jgi:hypothetical protein
MTTTAEVAQPIQTMPLITLTAVVGGKGGAGIPLPGNRRTATAGWGHRGPDRKVEPWCSTHDQDGSS